MESPHEFAGKLRWEQQEVVDKFFSRGRARSGILQAPCGWGKTFTGCEIISKNNTKTLIMVHTNCYLDNGLKNWRDNYLVRK